ncbi:pali-domain-containing protein [Auriculariales sp. MPI-PUGE-AT-0066]|nr:pali-domain-containing protein [Auriculariales sp. MPI-PUGE-AT-0066]
MVSPAVPGLFFCAAACALLIIASVSVPVWDSIYFLKVRSGGDEMRFGAWGYTGTSAHLGYYIPPEIVGVKSSDASRNSLHALTFVMVLHPIAAAFAGLSVIFGLCGAAYSRAGTIMMTLSAALATLVTLVVWIIDMCLWGIAHHRVNHDTSFTATWGNANWIVLGALVSLLIGSCTGLCGSCGRFRHRERTTTRV